VSRAEGGRRFASREPQRSEGSGERSSAHPREPLVGAPARAQIPKQAEATCEGDVCRRKTLEELGDRAAHGLLRAVLLILDRLRRGSAPDEPLASAVDEDDRGSGGPLA